MAIFNTVYGGEWSWKPGSNTILYVPMSSDLSDHGPNQITLTNNGVSLVSSQANIDVGYFNGSSDLAGAYSSLFNLSDFHVGVWLKFSAINSDCFIFSGTSSGDVFFGYGRNIGGIGIGRNGVAWDNTAGSTLNTNTWYYISFDRAGTSLDISVNATSYGPFTNSNIYTASGGYRIGNDANSHYINGYMSDLIIEDEARTSDKRTKYYNSTKGNY